MAARRCEISCVGSAKFSEKTDYCTTDKRMVFLLNETASAVDKRFLKPNFYHTSNTWMALQDRQTWGVAAESFCLLKNCVRAVDSWTD